MSSAHALTTPTETTLNPILASELGASAPSGTWVGVIDDREIETDWIALVDCDGLARARILVRRAGIPRGFVEMPIEAGRIEAAALLTEIADLPEPRAPIAPGIAPVSIAVCTLERPRELHRLLESLAVVEYAGDLEIVVVDNSDDPATTQLVVTAVGDKRTRVVHAPVRGTSRARNLAVQSTRYDVIAFLDDDVIVDQRWLDGLIHGFAASSAVGCVCAMVASAELRSAAQIYFDWHVDWADRCQPEVFSLDVMPPGEPLFPFQCGRYGTGASFAIRRDVVIELGGFDEALGGGSPAGAAEDIDLFVRAIIAGHDLAYEPAALVWHGHRSDLAGLRRQVYSYGVGRGAWLTKLLAQSDTRWMLLKRVGNALVHYARKPAPTSPAGIAINEMAALLRLERNAMASGPAALAKARRRGAQPRPLDDIAPSPQLLGRPS